MERMRQRDEAKKADEPMADQAEPRRSTRNKPTASQADKLVDDTTIQTDPVTDTVMTEDDQPQLPPAMPQQLPPPVPPAQQPTSWRNWLPLSSLLSGQQSSGEIEEFD